MTTKYTTVGQLPIWSKLRSTCEGIRDKVVIPLRTQMIELKEQLEAEKSRLSKAQGTPQDTPTRPSSGLVDNTPPTGRPGSGKGS